MSTHSAAPQAIGYYHQPRYALFALLIDDREDVQLIIEGRDDFELLNGDKAQLGQLKHHIKKEANITDSGADLWKTIRVWSDSYLEETWEPEDMILQLITTASAPKGSIASMLKNGDTRDEKEAHLRLIEICNNSKNKDLQTCFKAFTSLGEKKQKLLIMATSSLPDLVSLV